MSMIQWYRRFVGHGMRYGIYIPPFESLDGCLVRESMMFIRMSQTTWRRCHSVSLRLSAIFMCSFTYHCHERNATCLFEALDNIMQSIHPRLTVRTDIRDHLHWMPKDDIHCYISCWFDCILLE